MENEYCKNLRQVGHETSTNKCESIQLMRIYSPHLLPIKFGLLKSATSVPKLYYYLCVLDESSKLNYLRERVDDHPNKIRNDNLNEGLRWMDYAQLKQAQLTYNLMGMEPVLFYKQYLGAASQNQATNQVANSSDENNSKTTTTNANNNMINFTNGNLNISTSIETILFEPVLTYFPVEQNEAVTSPEQLIVSAKFNKSSN